MADNKNTRLDSFKKIFQFRIEQAPPRKGDYKKDGILYCGVCKEPKREWYQFGEEWILGIRPCKCVRDKEARQKEIEAYDEKMQRVQNLRSGSLMDSAFYEATFEKFIVKPENESQYKTCTKYVSRFKEMLKDNQGLLFYGDVGTGKSFTAACIANRLMDNFVPVIMTSFVKILQGIAGYGSDDALMNNLAEVDLLIIDDLGAERNTDYAIEKVYNVIDSRYRTQKPIILTTNLTLQEMKQCTDRRYTRIYDRVFEMCYPIKFSGTSWRKIEAKNRFDTMKKILEGDD